VEEMLRNIVLTLIICYVYIIVQIQCWILIFQFIEFMMTYKAPTLQSIHPTTRNISGTYNTYMDTAYVYVVLNFSITS